MKLQALSLAFALLGAAATASASELVYNGDFTIQDSSGVYGAGWTVDSVEGWEADEIFQNWHEYPADDPFTDAPDAVTAFLGYDDENTDTISQSINTAGYSSAMLSVTFTSDAGDFTGFDFMHLWFGGQLIDAVDVGSETFGAFQKTVTYDLTPMFDGTTKTLAVDVALDSSFPTWVWVENVSVQAQAVPEPATLTALSLGAFAVLRRKRKA